MSGKDSASDFDLRDHLRASRLGLAIRPSTRRGAKRARCEASPPSWRRFLGPMPSWDSFFLWIRPRGARDLLRHWATPGVGERNGLRETSSRARDIPQGVLRALTTRRWSTTGPPYCPRAARAGPTLAWPTRESPIAVSPPTWSPSESTTARRHITPARTALPKSLSPAAQPGIPRAERHGPVAWARETPAQPGDRCPSATASLRAGGPSARDRRAAATGDGRLKVDAGRRRTASAAAQQREENHS